MRLNVGDHGNDVLAACKTVQGAIQQPKAGNDGQAVEVALQVAELACGNVARGSCDKRRERTRRKASVLLLTSVDLLSGKEVEESEEEDSNARHHRGGWREASVCRLER